MIIEVENYMDTKTQKAIRNRVYRKVWDEFKSEITMKDLAGILNVPIATFFRIVNSESGRPSESKKKIKK